jgi:hypothetical protein
VNRRRRIMVKVEPIKDIEYQVTVDEDGSTTTHVVTLDDQYHTRLTGESMSKEELITKSFEFLLTKEPKEAILRKFHLKEISRYFPDFESTVTE